eukprot:RCo002405
MPVSFAPGELARQVVVGGSDGTEQLPVLAPESIAGLPPNAVLSVLVAHWAVLRAEVREIDEDLAAASQLSQVSGGTLGKPSVAQLCTQRAEALALIHSIRTTFDGFLGIMLAAHRHVGGLPLTPPPQWPPFDPLYAPCPPPAAKPDPASVANPPPSPCVTPAAFYTAVDPTAVTATEARIRGQLEHEEQQARRMLLHNLCGSLAQQLQLRRQKQGREAPYPTTLHDPAWGSGVGTGPLPQWRPEDAVEYLSTLRVPLGERGALTTMESVGTYWVFGTDGGVLHFLDTPTARLDFTMKPPGRTATEETEEGVTALLALPSEGLLVSGHHNGLVLVWSLDSCSCLVVHSDVHEGAVWCFARAAEPTPEAPAGALCFFSGSGDGTAGLWTLSPGTLPVCTQKFNFHDGGVRSLCVARAHCGQAVLCSGGEDSVIVAYGLRDQALLGTFLGHTDTVTALAWAFGPKLLLSGGRDGTLRAWECGVGISKWEAVAHLGGVTQLALIGDGTFFATTGDGVSTRDTESEEGSEPQGGNASIGRELSCCKLWASNGLQSLLVIPQPTQAVFWLGNLLLLLSPPFPGNTAQDVNILTLDRARLRPQDYTALLAPMNPLLARQLATSKCTGRIASTEREVRGGIHTEERVAWRLLLEAAQGARAKVIASRRR